jgi:hypothetical protein
MDRIDLAQGRDKLRGCCGHCNEHSGSVECWEFLNYLRSDWPLTKDPAARSSSLVVTDAI